MKSFALTIGNAKVEMGLGVALYSPRGYLRAVARQKAKGAGTRGYAFQDGDGYFLILLRDTGVISDMIGVLAHEALHVAEWIAPGKRQGEARGGLVAEIVRLGVSELFGGQAIDEIH